MPQSLSPSGPATVPPLPARPSSDDLRAYPLLPQPLVPVTRKDTAAHRISLAAVLNARQEGRSSDVDDLLEWAEENPLTSLTTGVWLNVAELSYELGRYSIAHRAWQAAWQAARLVRRPEGAAVADRGLAGHALMCARLGRTADLRRALAATRGREATGDAR